MAAPCAAKSPCSESTPTFFMAELPAAGLQQLGFGNLGDVESGHGFAERAAGFEQLAGVVKILSGLHDGFGARGGVGGLKDAGANEDGLGAELHDERGVGGSGDAAGGEVGHGELTVAGPPFDALRSDLKMPEPTKTASAPSCMTSAASAGVAMPPAEKLGTGSLPWRATHSTSSSGAAKVLGWWERSSFPRTGSCFISVTMVRMWRTASTILPEPASPLVRTMVAPSPMRRRASPRLRAPQTKGGLKPVLSMWCSSSAGVRTSPSSMKSTPSASRMRASMKWPMRALAITGMVTVFMISSMMAMLAMRATPPSRRMSEGTRSRAMTADAPASSAILACWALVTSMMTPPFNISARPTLTRNCSLAN